MKFYTVAAILALSTQAKDKPEIFPRKNKLELTNYTSLTPDAIVGAAEVWSTMSQDQKNDSLLLMLSAIQNVKCFPLLLVNDQEGNPVLIDDTSILDDFFTEKS